MLIKKQASGDGINLPVKVTGFVEDGGQVGVVGEALAGIDKGREVSLFLTTTGHNAQNESRMPISKLRDGFKIGRDKYRLVPGGVVSFKGAFPKEPGQYIGLWPNVLAYNAQDAGQYVRHMDNAVVRLFEKDGKHFGYALDLKGGEHFAARTGGELVDGVKAFAARAAASDAKPSTAFLLRYLDGAGAVLNYALVTNTYTKDNGNWRNMSPDETAALIAEVAGEAKEGGTDYKAIDVLPAERLSLSPKSLQGDENGKSNLAYFQGLEQAFNKHLEGGDLEICAKETFAKMGGEHGEFVARIDPVFSRADGADPVLIGGLSYAGAPGIDDEQGQPPADEGRQAPAPEPDPGGPDPFAGLDEEPAAASPAP